VRYVNPINNMERKINAAINSSPVAKALIAKEPRSERDSARTMTLITTAIGRPLKTLAINVGTLQSI
jgi:hypothetical protein